MQASTSTSALSDDCGKGFAEIYPRYLFGDRMVDPSLFNKRDEQRACHLVCRHPMPTESLSIGVATDGCLGCNNDSRAGGTDCGGGGCSWFNHTHYRDFHCLLNLRQSQGRGAVTGDHQQVNVLRFEESGSTGGVTSDRLG